MIETNGTAAADFGAQQRRFARHASRVEVVATLRDPLHRPYGLIGLLLILLAGAIVAAGFADTTPQVQVGAVIIVTALTALYWTAAIYAASRLGAARAFTKAAARWWHQPSSANRAAAAALVTEKPDGGHQLQWVCAAPTGAGLGRDLVANICADADHTGVNLALRAVNRRAAQFYRQFGFTQTGRAIPLRGIPMARTTHQSESDQQN